MPEPSRNLDLDRPASPAAQTLPPSVVVALDVGDWRERAACRGQVTGHAADVFYGPGWGHSETETDTAVREQQAKQVCAGCPVRRVCLQVALLTLEPHGLWGGMTADERRDLLARTGTGFDTSKRPQGDGLIGPHLGCSDGRLQLAPPIEPDVAVEQRTDGLKWPHLSNSNSSIQVGPQEAVRVGPNQTAKATGTRLAKWAARVLCR